MIHGRTLVFYRATVVIRKRELKMQVKHYPEDNFETHKCGTPNTVMMRLKIIDFEMGKLKAERKRVLEQCIAPYLLLSTDRSVTTDNGKVGFYPENTNHKLNTARLIGTGKDKSTVSERRGGDLANMVSENDWSDYWVPVVISSHFKFHPSKG
jgi:hypothetical protein